MGSSGIQCVKIARAVLAECTVMVHNMPRGFAVPTPRIGKCVASAACQDMVGLNISQSDVLVVKQLLGIGTSPTESTPGEILDLLAWRTFECRSKAAWLFPEGEISGGGGLEPAACGGSKGGPADRTERSAVEALHPYERAPDKLFVIKRDDARYDVGITLPTGILDASKVWVYDGLGPYPPTGFPGSVIVDDIDDWLAKHRQAGFCISPSSL